MATLPLRSPGVLAAPLGDLTVLYDLATEVVHVLNPSAGLLWAACDGTEGLDALALEVARASGTAHAQVAADLRTGLRRLEAAAVVGRTDPAPSAPSPLTAPASPGAHSSAVFGALDDAVVIRSDDAALVTTVDRLLASLLVGRQPSVVLGVAAAADGSVRVTGHGPEQGHPSVAAFLDQLPSALNQVAATSASCLALHAGCVRSPSGEVVVLPGTSGSGKSTLTAALVQADWAYGTDEAVGIRVGSLAAVTYPKPLVIDAAGRAVLGLPAVASPNVSPTDLGPRVTVLTGDAGAVSRVVLPRFEPGAELTLSAPLPPDEALVAVIEHALNLARVGDDGLAALCQLAASVPVQRLVHGGAAEAAARLSRG